MRWLLGLSVLVVAAMWAWRWLLSESDLRQRQLNRKWYELDRSRRYDA